MTITVNKKQNLLDICLQVYGTTQKMFYFAAQNGISPDSDIEIGQELTFDNTGDLEVLNRIQRGGLDMVNPIGDSQQDLENIWQDGISQNFTDGNTNDFTFET